MKKSAFLILVAMVSGANVVDAENAPPPVAPATQAAPAAPSAGIRVEKIAVGTAIENKEISGAATQFDGSVMRLYCWTKVTADQAPVPFKHVWYADGKKEAEVALEIKYSAMRTWSSKAVWPGSWKVDATDEQGSVLSSTEFTVTKETAQPAPPAQTGQ